MASFTFHKATKEQIKLRMALCGPSGSGKTFTALTFAGALGKNVALIDTENGSANKYADKFDFSMLVLNEFSIENYIKSINAAVENGFDVVIVDSLSHAWIGNDGALSMLNRVAPKYNYNTAAAWSEVTPLQNQLVDTILRCPIHLIATMRTKTEWDFSQKENGKIKPIKLGTKPVQRDGIDYEFDIVGDLDVNHNLIINKTRCEALDGAVIQKPTIDLAYTISQWLNDGETEPDRESDDWKKQMRKFHALGTELYEDRWDTVRHQSVQKISRGMYSSSKQLKQTQLDRLIEGMEKVRDQRETEQSNQITQVNNESELTVNELVEKAIVDVTTDVNEAEVEVAIDHIEEVS